MNERYFRELVEGTRTGWSADAVRMVLGCAEIPYSWIMRLRNGLYDCRIFPARSVGVPIVSVGNLTLGGTGKTPMVAHLTQWARDRNLRPGLISRGYRKGKETAGSPSSPFKESPFKKSPLDETASLNDEGRELALRFPDVPHEQSPDRIAAAQRLLNRANVDLLILDDGFQHRRIERNLDIVLLDSKEPFGHGRLFPRGLLRESVRSLSRADIVLLSRADRVDSERREEIRKEVSRLHPKAVWGEIAHLPTELIAYYRDHSSGVGEPDFATNSETSSEISSEMGSEMSSLSVQRRCSLEQLRGKRVVAFSGIGQPTAFRATLEPYAGEIAAFLEFSDHHSYTTADLQRIENECKKHRTDAIVCTMKDLVKIQRRELGSFALWGLAIGITFLHGEAEFNDCCEKELLL